jgi:hypothetical protein
MSEAPKKAIPRPALPEDFEELARTLFAEIWEVPLAALHGGRGQRQYGVDVLADSPKGRFGIQCKLHGDGVTISAEQLASELTAEIEKAKGFQPPLARFVFATTARRRGEVQRLAAEITTRHREEGLFEVSAFFWEDFAEHLRSHRSVYRWYMGQHFSESGNGSSQDVEDDPGLISGYLDKLVGDHDKIVPYFQQRAELDLLDRVYVQLELRPEHREPLELADEKLRPGRPFSIRDLLALDPEKDPWVTHRWVVLGDPGAGKTTPPQVRPALATRWSRRQRLGSCRRG